MVSGKMCEMHVAFLGSLEVVIRCLGLTYGLTAVLVCNTDYIGINAFYEISDNYKRTMIKK